MFQPMSYINMLVGHEGPGSLYSFLKDRNWCEYVTCGYETFPGFSFFGINVGITKEAMDHIDDIVKLIFQVDFF